MRSLVRFDSVLRVVIVMVLSSFLIPLMPGSADARSKTVVVEGAYLPNQAEPGQTVTTELDIRSRYSIPATSVQLNVTNRNGESVYSQTWSGVSLPANNALTTLTSSYTIAGAVADGERHQASVRIFNGTVMVAYEASAAELDVVADEPAVPTATALPPTATPEPTATSQPPTTTPADEPTEPTSILRVNSGGASFVDSRGLTWWADSGFSGGSGYSVELPIANTEDDALYASERWGTFSYSFPVENGTYDLRLMFAEVWWNASGQRIFSVTVNGKPALTKFDILAETQQATALDKIVPVAVTSGKLDISVVSGRNDYGKLNGFELLSYDSTPSSEPPATPTPTTTPEPSPTATSTPEPSPTATSTPEPAPTATATLSPPPASPSTIQAMIDAASPNSTVRVPAGTYREKIFINKPITLIAEPGVVVDGESRDRWIVGQAHDVTIDGFTFINSNQPQYHGGLSNDGYNNWTIRNSTFLDAGNAAIDIKEGSGHLIENNLVSRAGNVGIRIESVGSATIRGNTTHGNNTKNLDPGWEAGGMKITGNYGGVRNLVIENNTAHDNNGPGIWVDIDGEDIEIRNNRVYDNTRAGIIYELSFRARIHGNVVYNNGTGFDAWGFGAGILVQNSSDVEVFNNIVAWNPDGITVISQDRGAERWNNVTGNSIHDNTIITNHDGGWNTYALGWLEDWSGVLDDASSNNGGYNNQFWFSTPEGEELRYRWCGAGYWTVTDFSNSPGGQNSQHLSDSQKNQVLASAGL